MIINPRDYGYDIESYPNFFSCVIVHRASRMRWIFEVSDWQNDAAQFIAFLFWLQSIDARMIGFNNHGYDWQVIEQLIVIGPAFTARDAYNKNDFLINGLPGYTFQQNKDAKFSAMVWDNQMQIKQIDLYMIHHFDNFAKATSLKETEFNMRSNNVGDLPVKPGVPIPESMRWPMIVYNCHDVNETLRFADFSQPMIDFRENLIETFGWPVMNFNDTKIGKKYFEKELKDRAPHLLGTYGNKRQSPRSAIRLGDVILPSIEFETPQLQALLETLKTTTITQTKAPSELKDVTVNLEGFMLHIGVGGGHGSVEKQVVRPEEGWKLVDVDVASYYPSLAIENRFFPEHLSELFCDIYADVAAQRKQHAKKTAPNEMLKLALNGVYGDSGNEHSIFFDTQYMMQITVNGQLLLYYLAEKLTMHCGAKMIQLNTDGVTFLIRDEDHEHAMGICKHWEDFTGLTLEYEDYRAMWIRDVNNYIAQYGDGKLKRIGAYAHETQRENPATREVKWSKDHSALVVQKAAEAAMVEGIAVQDFIYNHDDAFDFMLRSKATGKVRQRLMMPGDVDKNLDEPDAGQWLQKCTRYYMAKNGGSLQMVHQPLAKNPEKERIIGKHVDYEVAICDDISDYDPANLSFEWYITEAKKLLIL